MDSIAIAPEPLISVVIPTYNRAGVIPTTIQSVLAQTYRNLEIIVVDDASADRTQEVVSGFSDRRIRYICHEQNRGGSVARNTGVTAAKGSFIAFLDSDDAWLPSKLEVQLAAILGCPEPQNTVIYSPLKSLAGVPADLKDELRGIYWAERVPQRGKAEIEPVADYLFCEEGVIQTSTLLLHSDLARRTRFDESLKKHQDYGLCLQLEANGAKFIFVEETLAIWNHDPQLDHIGAGRNHRASITFLEKYRHYFSTRAASMFAIQVIFRAIATDTQLLKSQVLAGSSLEEIEEIEYFLRRNRPISRVRRLHRNLSQLYRAFLNEHFFAYKHFIAQYTLASQLALFIARELKGRARHTSASAYDALKISFLYHAYLWAADHYWYAGLERFSRGRSRSSSPE